MKIKSVAILSLLVLSLKAASQNQTSAFGFLELPQSSHEAALGGRSVSLLENDPSLTYSNPASLCAIDHSTLGLNVMTWMAGTTAAGAQYSNTVGQRGSFAVSARYVGYGVSDETDIYGNINGTFSSRDISLGGSYSYVLSDRWCGGATIKMIYSKYGYYSSFSMAADLGLLYHSASGMLTAGISFTNIGGQIKAFQDIHETLPFNITAGISLRMEHAPVQVTLTLDHLNQWRQSDFYSPDGEISFGEMLARHISIGVDADITSQLYVALGLNLRNRAELAAPSGKGLAGFSIGAGLHLNRLSFGLSFGKYQISTSSFLFNFAVNI